MAKPLQRLIGRSVPALCLQTSFHLMYRKRPVPDRPADRPRLTRLTRARWFRKVSGNPISYSDVRKTLTEPDSRGPLPSPLGPAPSDRSRSARLGSARVASQIGTCRCWTSETRLDRPCAPGMSARVYLCGQNRVVISVSQAGEASTSAVSSRLS